MQGKYCLASILSKLYANESLLASEGCTVANKEDAQTNH